ncbi:unnamed protein product [Mytilus edulis]|uniref:C3H1-type domain-containing protein n=1 Tax=Mytilus edulis TaxID=6550 RepID=A0A8S3UVV5_MYTED|nr:unnamed protein product [Mytilus edulis]
MSRKSSRATAGNRLDTVIASLKAPSIAERVISSLLIEAGSVASGGGSPTVKEHGPEKAMAKMLNDLQSKYDSLEYEIERLRLEKSMSKRTITSPSSDVVDQVQEHINQLQLQNSGVRGKKARKITDFVWPNPLDFLESRHVIDIDNGNQIRTDGLTKKLTLGQVSIEQYGYASIEIMNDMLRSGDLLHGELPDYLCYIQSIFRLAANNVWASVLLYDMEYRDRQALEKFKWGTYISNLREFHLVQKPDSATAKAIQEIQNVSRSANNANYKDQNSGFNSYNKKGKGPFLPDGRTICSRFNTGDCYRKDCKLAHHCAICYAKNYNAYQYSTSFQFRQSNSVSTQQSSQPEFNMHGSKNEGTTDR